MKFVVKIALKIIIYTIIIGGVRVVIKKCFVDNSSEKSKNAIKINKLQLSKLFGLLAVIFSVILVFASSFPSNIQGKRLLIVMLILILFNVVLYFIALYLWMWEITFNTDGICKKTIFGTKKYDFSSINQYSIDKSKNVVISFSDGNKFRFRELEHISEITFLLKRNNIQFQSIALSESGVIKEGVVYRVISGLCVVAACVFIKLCMSVSNYFGIVFFGVLLIAGVIDFGKKICNKVIVSEKEIKIYRFLRKEKIVDISELKYVKRKKIDNLENVWVYSEEELLFKYRKSWDNAELLETIVRNIKPKQ